MLLKSVTSNGESGLDHAGRRRPGGAETTITVGTVAGSLEIAFGMNRG